VKPACQPSISLINDGFCHHSGARLVTTVSGQAKVIIQLPRGNLETFEARPLVLMQARQLLDNDQIFDCVVLLRRQKVDINYIVDYDSKRFLDNVSSFVSDSLAKNADILSLLVSSLEPNYNSLLKYQYRFQQLSQQQQLEQQQVLLTGNDKINVVCGALRVELLKLLREQNMTAALNPVLCTFAKQRPPLLSDGLGLISDLYCGGASHSSSSSTRSMQLASAKVQSAIKYLLFLADGVEVFNAALGECDFEMARAVARQCQMDPKAYLPLIEGFQNIGKGKPVGSIDEAVMRFQVFVHLNSHSKAIEYGIKALKLFIMMSESESAAVDNTIISVGTIADTLFTIVKANDLFASAISLLNSCLLLMPVTGTTKSRDLMSIGGANVNSLNICGKLLRRLRGAYGSQLSSKQQYSVRIRDFNPWKFCSVHFKCVCIRNLWPRIYPPYLHL
jgi:hypothetical protein